MCGLCDGYSCRYPHRITHIFATTLACTRILQIVRVTHAHDCVIAAWEGENTTVISHMLAHVSLVRHDVNVHVRSADRCLTHELSA